MFSLFYTAAVTVPLVVTIVFWLVLFRSNPRDENYSHVFFRSALADSTINLDGGLAYVATRARQDASAQAFPNKPFNMFILISINAVNTFIALVEILLLSSVQKQRVRGHTWSSKS